MITYVQTLFSCIITYRMKAIIISNPFAHLRRRSRGCNCTWETRYLNTCSSFEVILYGKFFS